MVNCLKLSGEEAALAPKGNRGADLFLNNIKISLKTEAARDIKKKHIHISKFMELGKGEWKDKEEDLKGLRKQFLCHLNLYDRILTLRCIKKPPPSWHYELVEIPIALLKEVENGKFE